MQCTQALNIIIHVCPGGRGTRKCCPKSSYCFRAMNLRLGRGVERVTKDQSSIHMGLKSTILPSQNVYLDGVDFLASEGCFP